MATPSLLLIPDRYKSGVLYSQLPESGAGDIDFTRASAATRVNASGLIESVASGVPRLDYTGGGCPSLLLEPQRTNLFLNSASGATQSITVTAVEHTLSFYNTGSVTLSGVASGTLEGTGTGVANRVSLTFTPTAGTLTLTVSGTITDVQLEEGSYPTSYIPTTSAAVTRAADVASKTGISSLIGQTEGTMYAEFNCKSVENTNSFDSIMNIATDANNSIDVLKNNTTSELYVFAIVGGVIQVNSVGIPGTNVLGHHKVALAYNLNDYVCYLDGVQVFTDTSATVPACSSIYVGHYLVGTGQLGGTIQAAALYTTRLSNSELASLTSL
jgi:hypothetical protein